MNICGCKTKCDCTIIAVIVSIIAGIVATFLNFSGTIAIPQFVLWIFFGVALGLLGLSLVAAPFIGKRESGTCLCTSLIAFFVGIFGTVLFSLVLVLIDIAAGGILASILTGLLIGLFALAITSAACIVKNLFDC
ncbi:MAG: hypothetical protein IKW03_07665 [Clostridia bacterium]|nr:hypothetical protein [Clostridia bacterium]